MEPGAGSGDHLQVAATYTAAADCFDDLPFWSHFGRATVGRLRLRPGARVLDFCCGTGASALPAAEAVGPAGIVLGIDITDALLERARAKASAAGHRHVTFERAAVESLRFPAASFDAVISVFGLFFVDDMAGLLSRAWSWLAPGGVLAITSWGEQVLAPGEALFWDAVRSENPTLLPKGHAGRLDTPDKIVAVFSAAGLPQPEIAHELWEMPLPAAEDFWPVILGTSNRAALDALTPEQQTRVRAVVLDTLRAGRVTSAAMDAWMATTRKDGEGALGYAARVG
jgi:ubiquinone/menaquinone biosynthesis C-methylase UbiE